MIRHYLSARPDTKKGNTSGFTIVELLIVIVVIAILVAITIVSYAAVTDNAKKQTAKTDAQTMATALNKYKADNGSFPTDLSQLNSTPKVQSTFQYTYSNTDDTYCLTASVNGASAFVKSGNSLAQDGGCPGHGVNGQSAITNLITNPSIEVNTTGWISGTATSMARSTAEAHSGSASLLYTTTAANQYGYFTMPSSGGKTYSVSLWAKGTGTLRVYFSRAPSGQSLGAGMTQPLTSTWQRYTTTATTDAPTTAINVIIWQNLAGNNSMYIDDVILTETSSPQNYADGNSANWVWNGAQNNSTSTGPAL